MAARAENWDLLKRSSDPVPGDAGMVTDEADHYSDVADTIREQAARLRRMSGSDRDLKGHYAEKLKEGMSDLADDLDKAHDRFAVTGQQLALLAPAITTARFKTKMALEQAEDEKESEDSKAADDPDYEPDTMPWERSDAQIACDNAMDDFDDVACSVARKIKDAADDDMKDSRWEKFKNFVSKIATALEVIRNIIGVVLVVLAVVALFVPGLNMLVLGLMLLSLAISVTLAATGNGSWTDVAWDVAGLLTLGIGSGALKMARAGRVAALAKQGQIAGKAAKASTFQRMAWNGGKGFRGALSRLRPSVISARGSAYEKAYASIANRAPLQFASKEAGSLKEIVTSGFNRDLAQHMRDLGNLSKEFPSFAPGRIPVSMGTVSFGTNFAVTGVAGVTSGIGLVDAVVNR